MESVIDRKFFEVYTLYNNSYQNSKDLNKVFISIIHFNMKS